MDLLSGEKSGSCKIFEIFAISDDIDWRCQTFEIESPDFEGFEDCE